MGTDLPLRVSVGQRNRAGQMSFDRDPAWDLGPIRAILHPARGFSQTVKGMNIVWFQG